jgi:hypothetical protein
LEGGRAGKFIQSIKQEEMNLRNKMPKKCIMMIIKMRRGLMGRMDGCFIVGNNY